MKNVRLILIGVLLLALSPGWAGAQSGHNLFQQALMQERTHGNLQEAIRLYERIALEFTEDRALAAKALVNLGNACEKLGVPGAQDAYRRIVEEFPDQAEQARTAVARLGALVGPRESEQFVAASQEPTYTLLLDELPGIFFTPLTCLRTAGNWSSPRKGLGPQGFTLPIGWGPAQADSRG